MYLESGLGNGRDAWSLPLRDSTLFGHYETWAKTESANRKSHWILISSRIAPRRSLARCNCAAAAEAAAQQDLPQNQHPEILRGTAPAKPRTRYRGAARPHGGDEIETDGSGGAASRLHVTRASTSRALVQRVERHEAGGLGEGSPQIWTAKGLTTISRHASKGREPAEAKKRLAFGPAECTLATVGFLRFARAPAFKDRRRYA